LFSIWNESCQTSTPSREILKSKIMKACRSEPNWPPLWILAINFYLKFDPSKIKDLIYEALASCSFCKDIYMTAFQSGVFDEEELTDIYEMMVEKEIRLHTFI
jgi:hypothetical protein